MNEREQRFMTMFDDYGTDWIPGSPEEQELLDLARRLSEADYSTESAIRDSLRSRLLHPPKPRSRVRFLRPVIGIAAALALVTILALTVPPLRALAQEIIDSLFNHTAGNTHVIEYAVEPTPINALSPAVAETFSTVAEAETATSLDIREPDISLSPYELTQVAVNHETQTVWLTYNTPGRNLSIYQRPAGLGWLDDGLVGSSAQIVPVDFGGVNGILSGEFVAGGWIASTDATPTGDNTVAQGTSWSSDVPQRRLRWQDANLVYEMTAFGGSGDLPGRDLMQEDLITIAKSMH